MIGGYNSRLVKRIASFEHSHPGVRQHMKVSGTENQPMSVFHRLQPTNGIRTPSLPRFSTTPQSTGSQIQHPTVPMRISGVTIIIRRVRNHSFVFIPIFPADYGPKLLSGSPSTGPLRRRYRREGIRADHLVNAGSEFRESSNPSAGYRCFYSIPWVMTLKVLVSVEKTRSNAESTGLMAE